MGNVTNGEGFFRQAVFGGCGYRFYHGAGKAE